jgi:hypothetical protein
MKKICSLFILLFPVINSIGQNLVRNPGFEEYTACPNAFSQLHYASAWIAATDGTPDYFHSCSTNSFSVPNNFWGYQPAHGGNGYAGAYLWKKGNTVVREYIEGLLKSPLDQGHTYHFEMFVNLVDSTGYTTNSIGAYFSDTLVSINNSYDRLPFTPQIQHTGAKFDKINWTRVSGDFIANGGEQYVIIGNFNTNANTNADTVAGRSSYWDISYVLIDDVSLACKDCTPAGVTNAQSTGIVTSPNPFSDRFVIDIAVNGLHEILVTDINSRPVLRKQFLGSLEINTSTFPSGVYFYEIRNHSGIVARDKVLKL